MESQPILSIKFHFDNFKRAVRSNDLVYNFDTGELKQSIQIRRMIQNKQGYFHLNHLPGAKMALPVFGTENQIKRAIKFYLPLVMKYERELKAGLMNSQREKEYDKVITNEISKTDQINRGLNLSQMPNDILISLVQTNKLKGKDLLNLCQTSKRLRDFCNSNYGDSVFRYLINRDYPFFESKIDSIPRGMAREAYLKLGQGGIIQFIRFESNYAKKTILKTIDDIKSIKEVITANNVIFARQTGGIVYSASLEKPKFPNSPQSKLRFLRSVTENDYNIFMKTDIPYSVNKIFMMSNILFALSGNNQITYSINENTGNLSFNFRNFESWLIEMVFGDREKYNKLAAGDSKITSWCCGSQHSSIYFSTEHSIFFKGNRIFYEPDFPAIKSVISTDIMRPMSIGHILLILDIEGNCYLYIHGSGGIIYPEVKILKRLDINFSVRKILNNRDGIIYLLDYGNNMHNLYINETFRADKIESKTKYLYSNVLDLTSSYDVSSGRQVFVIVKK